MRGLPRLHRRARLPVTVLDALQLGHGEQVLAHGVDERTGGYVVMTTWSLLFLTPSGQVVLRRPWAEVSGGGWEPQTKTISVTWTDSGSAGEWTLTATSKRISEVFRERVQASVVIDDEVRLGSQLVGRAAVRKDLESGEMFSQVVYARGVRKDDPAIQAEAAVVVADLRDQTGL